MAAFRFDNFPGYPPNCTPISASSGNVAASAAVATIAADADRRNYLAGLMLSASGATTGLAVNATVTGLVGGTMTFTFVFPAGVLVAAVPFYIEFFPAIPTTAINTAVVVTLPSGGSGNTNASAVAWGYQAP